jgi:type IV pilus assembly protein PilA
MNCPYCSASIAENVQFCPKCGTQMGSPLPDSPAYRGPLPAGFEPPTSGKAIGSLISGVFFLFLPASIVAVILGHLSLSEIRKSAGRIKGRGIATAGLVLGYIGIGAIPFIILIVAAIAIPNLLRAKMAANESVAVNSLRTYNTAIVTYAQRCPEQGFPASTAQLGPGWGDCNQAGLVSQYLAKPRSVKSGYAFIYQPMDYDPRGHVTRYAISADPLQPGVSGNRHFYIDETSIVRFEADKGATADSPPM